MTNQTLTTMPEIARTDNRMRNPRVSNALEWERYNAEPNQFGSNGGLVYLAYLGDLATTSTGLHRGQTTVCIFKAPTSSRDYVWRMTVHHPVYTNGQWLPVHTSFAERHFGEATPTAYVLAYRNAPAGAGPEGRTPLTGYSSTLKRLKEQAIHLAFYEAVFPVRMACEVWN